MIETLYLNENLIQTNSAKTSNISNKLIKLKPINNPKYGHIWNQTK